MKNKLGDTAQLCRGLVAAFVCWRTDRRVVGLYIYPLLAFREYGLVINPRREAMLQLELVTEGSNLKVSFSTLPFFTVTSSSQRNALGDPASVKLKSEPN